MSAKTYIRQLLDAVSHHMDIEVKDICKSREESCVSIRYSIISVLSEHFSDSEIASAMDISRASVNRLRNTHESFRRQGFTARSSLTFVKDFIKNLF